MSGLRYDPEYQAWRDKQTWTPPPPPQTAAEQRDLTNMLLGAHFSMIPVAPEVQKTVHEFLSPDGHGLSLTRFFKTEHTAATEPQPAVFYIHGGGMTSGTVEIFSPSIAGYVRDTGVQHFAIQYRKAPEAPAPGPTDDCYAGLAWLSEHASDFGVDPARIGIMGFSAGGGLAAGTALAARDRGLSPPIAKQILVYPMLDDRTISRITADAPVAKFLTWTVSDNVIGWTAYVGADKVGKDDADVPIYAAPARAADLSNLPRTYMDVGSLDIFRDENIDYAARLAKADVEVEFHVYPGVPHGFETIPPITLAALARANRVRAVQSLANLPPGVNAGTSSSA